MRSEFLDSIVVRIGHIDKARGVNGNAAWKTEILDWIRIRVAEGQNKRRRRIGCSANYFLTDLHEACLGRESTQDSTVLHSGLAEFSFLVVRPPHSDND